jgi:hypothetical protein
VPGGDLLGSDQDVLDQQTQHTLTFFDEGYLGLVRQLGHKPLQAVGEREVGLAVGEPGLQSVQLVSQSGFAGSQVRRDDDARATCEANLPPPSIVSSESDTYD